MTRVAGELARRSKRETASKLAGYTEQFIWEAHLNR